jgi:3-isopropylmalate/(R)-2-methylmalate dehydratase large subunit
MGTKGQMPQTVAPAPNSRGRTLAQKLLARASGQNSVEIGDILTVKVDLAMAHDSSGPRRWRPHLEKLGARLWDPMKVAIVSDHYVPAVDGESAAILKQTRDFVRDYEVANFFDMQGICHTILSEKGLLRPGIFVAGGDSHTPHAGAFGCYAAGFGATDMIGIVVTGQTWTIVPDTIRIDLEGSLKAGVCAKDIMLLLCAKLGMDNAFKAIEYGGSCVSAMSMDERMVMSNMAAELGCEAGLIAPDETTLAHIRAHDGSIGLDPLQWQADDDARYGSRHVIDVSALSPYVAAPHSPANAAPIETYSGVKIDQAYIGACVGAKLEDLHMAAAVLRGQKIASGTRLLVAPSSSRTTELAAQDGTLAILLGAGAILLPSGCGACAGMGAGLLAQGETCISTTNRNFKGRMGNAQSEVYLANPYTVAASAIAGKIADPRPMLMNQGIAA